MTLDPITAAALERTRENISERPWSAPDALETFDRACATAIDISGLARHPAGTCDACGHPAVELCVYREEDGSGYGEMVCHYCRACDPDAFYEPDAEIRLGDPVDNGGEQLGIFEIAPTSTMPGAAAARITGQGSLL